MKEEIKSYYQDRQIKEKTKAHFEKHKTLYCCIGTGVVVAGVTALACNSSITIKNLERNFMFNSSIDKSTHITNTTNVVSVQERSGRGHPGYMIRRLSDNLEWPSQSDCAHDVGVDPCTLSKHLNGLLPHAGNEIYERIPAN